MNKNLMLEVADRIEQHPERFDQLDYGDGQAVYVGGEPVCKTPACIAGWAAVLCGHGDTSETDTDPSRRIRQEARSVLDLTQAEAGRLFDEAWPAWWLGKAGIDIPSDPVEPQVPIASDAAAVLRTMVETGHIWGSERNSGDAKPRAVRDEGRTGMHEGSATPWGPAQQATELGDGVWLVETASHGGVRMTGKAAGAVPAAVRRTLLNGAEWAEEDCEASIVLAILEAKGRVRLDALAGALGHRPSEVREMRQKLRESARRTAESYEAYRPALEHLPAADAAGEQPTGGNAPE